RVLRQVAEGPVVLDAAAVGLGEAREDVHGRGLAGAVAAHQADPVAGLHAQIGPGQEDARSGAQLETGGGDHGTPSDWIGCRNRQPVKSRRRRASRSSPYDGPYRVGSFTYPASPPSAVRRSASRPPILKSRERVPVGALY